MAHEFPDRPLFGASIPGPAVRRRVRVAHLSIAVHALVLIVFVAIPALQSPELPEPAQGVRIALYDPPPPPPPPKLSGSALAKPEPTRIATPEPVLDADKLTTPHEEAEMASIEIGEPMGMPEGMEGGVEGGQVGGVPGGVLGGVIGGTGDGVVDYDQGPRILYQTKPTYPQEAAVGNIHGTVEVELVVGVDGRVHRVWVIKSIPVLDASAVQCVLQWVFSPAVKNGRPVVARVRAAVTFRLY